MLRLWAADVGEGGKQGRGKRRRKRKKRKRRKGEGADLISILSQLPLRFPGFLLPPASRGRKVPPLSEALLVPPWGLEPLGL